MIDVGAIVRLQNGCLSGLDFLHHLGLGSSPRLMLQYSIRELDLMIISPADFSSTRVSCHLVKATFSKRFLQLTISLIFYHIMLPPK